MIKFTVYIPTYNRPVLVRHAIASVLHQTYQDFEIIVFDNGSEPSVEPAVKAFNDPRIRFVRSEFNDEPNRAVERNLELMTGTHFIFLGDDDALTPHALEIIARLFQENPHAKIISTATADFNHTTGHPILKQNWDEVTGKLSAIDGIDILTFCCRSWGIGFEGLGLAPLRSHSSGTFLSKELIEATKARQGALFIKPFGDVGYLGASVVAEKIYFLDVPLAIIGHSNVQESTANRSGRRHVFDRYREDTAHLPVHGSTFISMGAASHLNVLHKVGLGKTFDSTLRPDFFLRYFLQIWSDKPKTDRTWRDVRECLLPALGSCILSLHPRRLWNMSKIFQFLKARQASQKGWEQKCRASGRMDKVSSMKFEDICDFSRWLEKDRPMPTSSTGKQISGS